MALNSITESLFRGAELGMRARARKDDLAEKMAGREDAKRKADADAEREDAAMRFKNLQEGIIDPDEQMAAASIRESQGMAERALGQGAAASMQGAPVVAAADRSRDFAKRISDKRVAETRRLNAASQRDENYKPTPPRPPAPPREKNRMPAINAALDELEAKRKESYEGLDLWGLWKPVGLSKEDEALRGKLRESAMREAGVDPRDIEIGDKMAGVRPPPQDDAKAGGTIIVRAPNGEERELPDTDKNRQMARAPGYSLVE